ncbi:hypothetical protein ANANG_G00124980 [Anguilla anguilla]|uniref:Uncharacterized protein n=1 Tax=Anguilla anguilla TaxID=7936 RepID=A0A9D3MG51_ANGAN|nr:hypothetical protein ANANG_G00124980 [Anguilla anguilla]
MPRGAPAGGLLTLIGDGADESSGGTLTENRRWPQFRRYQSDSEIQHSLHFCGQKCNNAVRISIFMAATKMHKYKTSNILI